MLGTDTTSALTLPETPKSTVETDSSPDNCLILRMSSPEHPSWRQDGDGGRAWMAGRVKELPGKLSRAGACSSEDYLWRGVEELRDLTDVPCPQIVLPPHLERIRRSWLRTSMNSGH